MDNSREHHTAIEAAREEYDALQRQLKKNRRFVYIGSCFLCLLIGFLVGVFAAYPRERTVIISTQEPAPEILQPKSADI